MVSQSIISLSGCPLFILFIPHIYYILPNIPRLIKFLSFHPQGQQLHHVIPKL